MNQSGYQVRRATVDDLAFLIRLWTEMHFAVPELERRLTDFQVVEGSDGQLLGAIALEINGRHGRVHSEVFADFGLAEDLRDLLWERMGKLITNYGLVRLWTVETAPFWTHSGFQSASGELLKKLPPVWAPLAPGWLTLQVRDEEAIQNALDREFASFKAQEQQQIEASLRRTRILKAVTMIAAILLGIFVMIISLSMLRSRMRFPGH